MADRKIPDHRDTEITGAFLQHFNPAEAGALIVIFTAAEAAKTKAAKALQRPRQSPVGQHAIQPVGKFADIFQNQDRPCEIRHVRAAEQTRRHGQIGGDERHFGRTLHPGLPLQDCQWFLEQQRP